MRPSVRVRVAMRDSRRSTLSTRTVRSIAARSRSGLEPFQAVALAVELLLQIHDLAIAAQQAVARHAEMLLARADLEIAGLERLFERGLGAAQLGVLGLQTRGQRERVSMLCDGFGELSVLLLELFLDRRGALGVIVDLVLPILDPGRGDRQLRRDGGDLGGEPHVLLGRFVEAAPQSDHLGAQRALALGQGDQGAARGTERRLELLGAALGLDELAARRRELVDQLIALDRDGLELVAQRAELLLLVGAPGTVFDLDAQRIELLVALGERGLAALELALGRVEVGAQVGEQRLVRARLVRTGGVEGAARVGPREDLVGSGLDRLLIALGRGPGLDLFPVLPVSRRGRVGRAAPVV